MNVYYKVVSTFLPGDGSNRKRIWFPQLTGSRRVGFNEIAKIIEKRSTLTDVDIIGVFTALRSLIPDCYVKTKQFTWKGWELTGSTQRLPPAIRKKK